MEPPKLTPKDGVDELFSPPSTLEEPWFKSLIRNVREALNPPKLPPLELTSRPLEGVDLGDISKIEQPWYKSLISNVKDLVNPPKLPPLQVTSKPVEVGSIWGAYKGGESKSGIISLLIHVGVIGLLLVVFRTPAVQKKLQEITPIFFPVQPYQPKIPAKQLAGGGGGQKMHAPAQHGEAPKFAPKQFTPPKEALAKPLLPVVPTINANAPQIAADNYGDPNALNSLLSGSMGNGNGSGIGNGNGNGYGPGSGGGSGGGAYSIGGVDTKPVPIYKPDPEYSEAARKAKYSGSVLLSLVIGPDGIPRDVHVIRPLGLGLDEKAVEAVMKWRFKPGMKDGHPVPVEAQVDVNFRLL